MSTILQSTRLFGRRYKSSIANPGNGVTTDPAAFDANGIADVNDGSAFAGESGIELLGEATMYWDIVTAGNSTLVFTVPTGKYWRLLSAVVRVTADANAANRVVVSTTRDSADTTIDAITDGTAITANQDLLRFILYDMAVNTRGAARVASQATLTIAEPVTAGDTFTLGGGTDTHSVQAVFTLVTALTQYGENEILVGASEAATKTNIDAALGATRSGEDTLHNVSDDTHTKLNITGADFVGDDMVFTAVELGAVGDNIVCTETFTHASNVFDAATFGTTTAGVDAVTNHAGVEYPAAGSILTPGEDVAYSITAGVAGDNFEVALTVLEYDSDPR